MDTGLKMLERPLGLKIIKTESLNIFIIILNSPRCVVFVA